MLIATLEHLTSILALQSFKNNNNCQDCTAQALFSFTQSERRGDLSALVFCRIGLAVAVTSLQM
jgi:hypothetical protein